MFEIKQQIINTLVKKVTIDRNRELHVKISFACLRIGQAANQVGEHLLIFEKRKSENMS